MKKIGIVGFGFVGQAIYSSFKDTSQVFVYDKYKEQFNDQDILLDCDFLFICVPTPTTNGEQDASVIDDVFYYLTRKKYQGICIVKSTVLLSNIEPWLGKLNIVMNPEFLNQNTASEDFMHQKLIILGGEATDCCDVRELYNECFCLPGATYQFTSIEEAINFKYIHNTYHAYQVLFWNYVQESIGNSRKYVLFYEKLYGRKPILSQIAPDGKLGYGGKCFPKDVTALNDEKPHMLTEFMCTFNKKLRPK